MRGERCLSPGDDDIGKYTMQDSIESFNTIEEKCLRTGCDIIVKFSKHENTAFGWSDTTNYEMGSFASSSCSYKSPVETMEVVYTKKGSAFRANEFPAYGP